MERVLLSLRRARKGARVLCPTVREARSDVGPPLVAASRLQPAFFHILPNRDCPGGTGFSLCPR
jgi:hypothetical protein